MAFVNVKRDVTDQFYRYKMPLLIAKVYVQPSSTPYATLPMPMTHIMSDEFCVTSDGVFSLVGGG